MSQTNPPPYTPLEALFARLREALGELAPEPLLERMRPVFEGFFDQFQLVPRREYDAKLENLEQLEETVRELEKRITELERHR
jgi:BMFP domain-containing protein YqiC